jgi:hypothetical protein
MLDRRITEELAIAAAMRPVPNLWDRTLDLPTEADTAKTLSVKGSTAVTGNHKALFESRYIDSQTSCTKSLSAQLDTTAKVPQRPQIEAPSNPAVINKNKAVAELNDLFADIKNIDADNKILRLIFERIQTQRDHRNASSTNTFHRIKLEQTHQKEMQVEEFKIHAEIDAANKVRITTDTLGYVFTAINITLLVAAIASAVATAGASIAAAVGALQALGSVGSGVNTGFATHYKTEADKQKALLEGVKQSRENSHEAVRNNLRHNAENEKNFASDAQLQRQMQDEAYKNTKMDPNSVNS